jgi:hypothetical protein
VLVTRRPAAGSSTCPRPGERWPPSPHAMGWRLTRAPGWPTCPSACSSVWRS